MAPKILIFGGSGGIGSAINCVLHTHGYDLHLAGRNEERLAAIARDLGATSTLGNVKDSRKNLKIPFALLARRPRWLAPVF